MKPLYKMLVIAAITLLAIAIWLFLFYQFYFLRQPERAIPNHNQLFVSPANGKIIAIIKQDELVEQSIGTGLFKESSKVIEDRTLGFSSGATLISIMMTPWDVHYQRGPTQAQLIEEQYVEGRFFNAMKNNSSMKSTFQNEYNNLLFSTPEAYQFRVIQIAGRLARRIEDYLNIGDTIQQGEVFWLIKLGSQVSIILDDNFEVTAKVGDKVVEGESVLAKKR